MGEPIDLTFSSGIFANYCFTTWQQLAVDMVNGITGETASDASFNNLGNTTPAPNDRTKPWYRLNADGTPDKWYVFNNGAWIAKHPLPAGSVMLYRGSLASIDTFDGGEAGTITATTGPMWQVVSTIAGRFPLHPGTLASGLVVNVGDTGGEEEHELLLTEIPNHDHNIGGKNLLSVNAPSKTVDLDFTGSDAGGIQGSADGGDSANSDATTPHNNMPPWLGIWFIERSARTHYRI